MPLTDRSLLPNVWEVALGGLLHDIGKLYQRAAPHPLPEVQTKRASDVLPMSNGKYSPKGTYSHWHALWTDAFFDWAESIGSQWPVGVDRRWVRDLAVYHHKPLQAYPSDPGRLTTWLVTLGDRLASGAERKPKDEAEEATEKGRAAFRRTPLRAQMAGISLKDGKAVRGRAVLRPTVLDAATLVPVSELPGAEVEHSYAALWDIFQKGWKELTATSGQQPSDFEEGLLSLSEQTMWAVPSSTMDQPDVSLHDHSRAVAAFSAALFHHHCHLGELTSEDALRDGRRAKFRFLVGDLSGLQATLFRLASENVKGLNRILRGRSARFSLIADAAARRALAAFGMPFSAALQTAGGRFLLLLPDLGEEETARRCDELRTGFDEWLAEQYYGDLGIGLALSDAFAPQDLTARPDESDRLAAEARANSVRNRLRIAVEIAKLKQLQGPASRGVLGADYSQGVCSACGQRPAQEGERLLCRACEAEHGIGTRLPGAKALVVNRGTDASFGLFGLNYELRQGAVNSPSAGWRLPGSDSAFPVARRLGHAYVARVAADEVGKIRELRDHGEINEGDIKTFVVLAQASRETVDGRPMGREMLALLKADVDRLGQIFARGQGTRWSLARTAALSRMIDGYFSIRLPDLLQREFPETYTVYAGGDDLMLVGPWRQMLALAKRLSADFHDFTHGNPDVTLSAGIALFDARTPISIAAHEAEERLSKAKTAGRNRIGVIEEEPLAWNVYARALDQAERLNGHLRAGTLPTSGLHHLLTLLDARERVNRGTARPHDYAWRARLGYHLARNLPQRSTRPAHAQAMNDILELFGLNGTLEDAAGSGDAGRLAITHALYRNR